MLGRRLLALPQFALHPLGWDDRCSSTMKTSPSEAPDRLDALDTRNSALSRLFVAHNKELLSFLMTRLGEAEAREVAQESYARLLRLDQPETLSFLRAYLFKTAANLSIDRLRHRQTLRATHPQVELLQELQTTPTPEAESVCKQAAGTRMERNDGNVCKR
jgi:DNA-directed RNA polymerase specialized sigma24 family protein